MEGREETRPVLASEICPDRVSRVIDPEKALLGTFGALAKSTWQPVSKIVADNRLIWLSNNARGYERAICFYSQSRFHLSTILSCAQEVARNVICRSEYMATSWNSSETNSPTILHVQKVPPLPCRKGDKMAPEKIAAQLSLDLPSQSWPKANSTTKGCALDPRTLIEARRKNSLLIVA